MKIVSIFNQKGGVGKTTISTNIASNLANEGYKVLLIDLDPQGNSTSGLGLDKRKIKTNIYDVLTRKSYMDDAIIKSNLLDNLYIVPCDTTISLIDYEMVDKYKREYLLKNAISDLEIEFDFILLDCPPSINLITLNSFIACNSVIVPIEAEFYSLEGLANLYITLDMVKRTFNPNLKIEGIIANKYDNRTRLNKEVMQEVKEFFKDKVYKSFIPKNIKLAEAPSFGLPILLYANESTGANACKDITQEFLQNQI